MATTAPRESYPKVIQMPQTWRQASVNACQVDIAKGLSAPLEDVNKVPSSHFLIHKIIACLLGKSLKVTG